MSVQRQIRLARPALLAVPITALVLAALLLTWGHESSTKAGAAGATNPAPGLNFSIGIDEADGCDTLGGDTKCTLPEDAAFTVSVSLDSMPDKVTVYEGMDMVLHYSGVISHDDADIATYWPECTFEATHYEPGLAAFSCAAFNPPDSEYLGVLAKIHFDCSASGSITLVGAAEGDTGLASGGLTYREGHNETLTVNCGSGPPVILSPTPTNTPPRLTPTNTPQQPTNTPQQPTNTPVRPTNTPVRPTNTPQQPTPTNTQAQPTGTPLHPTNTPPPPTATKSAVSLPPTGLTGGSGFDGGMGAGFWAAAGVLLAACAAGLTGFGWKYVRRQR